MKTWIIISVSVLMILSFLLIWMLSPSDSAYASQFSDNAYVTVAAFDVPKEGEHILSLIESLPFAYRVEHADTDQISIQLSTQFSPQAQEYVKSCLSGSVYVVPDDGVRVNLDLTLVKPLLYYKGETFSTAHFFKSYKDLLAGEHTREMKIVIPENYTLDRR